MNEKIFALLFFASLIWGFYKAWRTKNERLFYGLLTCISIQLILYPLKLSNDFAFAFCAFVGFAILLYKILFKGLDKSLSVCAVIFLVLGIVFLLRDCP